MRSSETLPPVSSPSRTLSDWGDLPKDEPGELVDGQLVEDEEVGLLHEVVVAWLIGVLRAWLAGRGGFVAASDVRFRVSFTRGRKPDISVFLPGKRPEARGLVSVAPDIMIEVVSPRPKDARRDRIEKLAEYAAFGVRYYWIVDPEVRTLEIFELGADARYVRAAGAAGGVLASVPGCDDLVLDVGALWAEADRLLTNE